MSRLPSTRVKRKSSTKLDPNDMRTRNPIACHRRSPRGPGRLSRLSSLHEPSDYTAGKPVATEQGLRGPLSMEGRGAIQAPQALSASTRRAHHLASQSSKARQRKPASSRLVLLREAPEVWVRLGRQPVHAHIGYVRPRQAKGLPIVELVPPVLSQICWKAGKISHRPAQKNVAHHPLPTGPGERNDLGRVAQIPLVPTERC